MKEDKAATLYDRYKNMIDDLEKINKLLGAVRAMLPGLHCLKLTKEGE